MKTVFTKTAAAFFLCSFLFPYRAAAADSSYKALSSQAPGAAISVPDVPEAVPAPLGERSGKMNYGSESSIIGMSGADLAAATPDQKVQMLNTLIRWSNPNQQNGDSGPDQAQQDREAAIFRILGSAKDAATFDQVYYRLNPGRLLGAVTYQSQLKDMVNKSRATVVPGDWEGLRKYINTVTGTVTAGRNLIKFLIDGREVIPVVTPALKAATKSIHIEIFHLQADKIGWGLAKILSEKAKAGVTVRFMIDEHGSKVEHEPELRKLIASMRESGAAVIVKKPGKVFEGYLDHRKVMVIDGRTAFTGGMNIGSDYQEKWHDQQTLVVGPAVAKLQEAFLERWKKAGGGYSSSEDLFPALEEASGGSETQIVGHWGHSDYNIKALYIRAIGTAQKTVRIATPYFGDKDVIEALKAAARRGVKVQLVFPKENNIPVMLAAARASYPALLKAGVEIYEYKGRMSHLKVTAIDGVWATFGSSNLDARSLKNNDELNLVINDAGVAQDIETRLFGADIPQSDHITQYSPGVMDHVAGHAGGLL